MLNANLAFLAIQSVDVNRNPYRSPAQISSYLSVTANIGSIVLGLLLMRHNRMETQTDEIVSHFRLSILSYLPAHTKDSVSCVPSLSTTRSGNTRDLVQSSLCSPNVGVCSPSIHSKFVLTYIYHYHSV
jgi:hypothetical protein